eukprot:215419-Chlamydomonas_euryale.AAC.4
MAMVQAVQCAANQPEGNVPIWLCRAAHWGSQVTSCATSCVPSHTQYSRGTAAPSSTRDTYRRLFGAPSHPGPRCSTPAWPAGAGPGACSLSEPRQRPWNFTASELAADPPRLPPRPPRMQACSRSTAHVGSATSASM